MPCGLSTRSPACPCTAPCRFGHAQEAIDFPRGRLRLAHCARCGFITNELYDPTVQEYSTNCEESQAFSPTFNAFARSLAERWVDRYGIRNKTIVEIGCGKGDFLMLICEAGNNRGIGIDPSAQPERIPAEFRGRVRFIQELYGDQHAGLPADVVLCRHTLEHIAPTREFLPTIRRVIGDRQDVVVLFELPDAVRVLREGAFWDIYYEHCSYFTPGRWRGCSARAGSRSSSSNAMYGDQYSADRRPPGGQGRRRRSCRWRMTSRRRRADVEIVPHEKSPRQMEHWRRQVLDRTCSAASASCCGARSRRPCHS